MILPTLHGIIERRILINYAIDPQVAQAIIPAPFRPQLYNGYAIGGICLIRLKNIRPKGLPHFLGISSENGAHRFAVEWDENGVVKQGVYIPRRDTSSMINALAGGRIFPGKHYKAKFNVQEENGNYTVGFTSSDAATILINASKAEKLESNSIFPDLNSVSQFMQTGCLGHTPCNAGFDSVKLHTYSWEVTPLKVHEVESSYFNDETLFPKSSIAFDNALLMENIEHEWQVQGRKKI